MDSFVYSNPNAHLLSAILTEATGQSVLDFARGALFDPLGIRSRPAFEQFGQPGEPGIDELTSGCLRAEFAWPVDPTGINNGTTEARSNG